MYAKKILTTEKDFTRAFEALVAFIGVVLGVAVGRPRFKSFVLPDEVRDYKTEAISHFVEGNYFQAVGNVNQAVSCLYAKERAYARNAVEKFFQPLMAGLGKLDNDLNEAIGKRFVEYVEVIRLMHSSKSYDMNEVSAKYWALLERIESAPKEQAARLANREKKEKKAELKLSAEALGQRKLEQDRRDEASRQAQVTSDLRRKAEREAQSRDLETKFKDAMSASV